MLKINITLIWGLIKFFTSREIEETAETTGFKQRDSKLQPCTFFKAFTIGLWSLHEVTLTTLAGKCETLQSQLQLTRQGLFARISSGASFLKELLNQAMNHAAKKVLSTETMEVLKQFRDVHICDSSVVSLPDKLEGQHKGLGGTNAKAAVKIHVVFSIISRTFKIIEILAATGNDSSKTTDLAAKLLMMELIIFDLGYYNAKAFRDIDGKGAFFISRVKSNTVFYEEDPHKADKYIKIDIAKDLKLYDTKTVDKWIYIGGTINNRMKVRLVAVRLPDTVAAERIRKARKKAKAKGKELTKNEIRLLAWNVMITNVPEDMLNAKTICELYRIRWQVELIFKCWKGCFRIDEMDNVGDKYFECLLYGRLIIITLMTTVYSWLVYMLYFQSRELLSFMRFFKNLREKLASLIGILQAPRPDKYSLMELFEDVVQKSKLEKRKRKTTEQELMEHDLPEAVLQMLA
jgi:hypothetical protein